jgi:hypothetical protein
MVSDKVSLIAPYLKARMSSVARRQKTLESEQSASYAPAQLWHERYVGWNSGPWHEMPNEQRYQIFRRTSQGRVSSNCVYFW